MVPLPGKGRSVPRQIVPPGSLVCTLMLTPRRLLIPDYCIRRATQNALSIRVIDTEVICESCGRMKDISVQECVELFHLLLLSFLGKKLDKQCYALKGGLRLVFSLGRLT